METTKWIKEVEMVDSVDGLMSSSSTRGIQMSNLHSSTRCESYMILTSREESVWRNQRPRSRDRFLCGTQIAYLIYENFRVTRANDSVGNYADVVTIGLRNDSIQEFDSKWDGILLSLTKILPATILEGLYKLRIRVSQKFKTVLEL